MGKRTRKTRWRTLPIGDEQSDSEESNSTLDTRVPPTYHQKYYNKFTYSSQSTPTRRYQSDSTKSTRSSSTTSENKITFNEDEYTRITTPRQDVLFKKGYLNKPKTYTSQTSTGNSTTSTGNSTGNGTPDYQSTDLEYESQFVFPNGFLDQNGIYYVNSYDPYPLMVYNAPTYYNNDSCGRTKKYSTESLTESASTSNEETSQEASASAANQNGVGHGDDVQHVTPPPPQLNGHHPQHHMPPPAEYGQVYNVVYPGFYYNGLCPPQEMVNCQTQPLEPKRIKRRRRRKLPSDSNMADGHAQNGTASEYTEDEFSSVEEEDEQAEKQTSEDQPSEDHSTSVSSSTVNQTNENQETEAALPNTNKDQCEEILLNQGEGISEAEKSQLEVHETPSDSHDEHATNETAEHNSSASDANKEDKKVKYDLKPDAQEFVPRAMRPENLQYIKLQPGFMPVPMMSPMAPPNFGHPAFLPPGMPVGYIQQNPPLYPGYMPGFLPAYPESIQTPMGVPIEEIPQAENGPHSEPKDKNNIDIRTVVSKLEEVANDSQAPEKRNLHNGVPYKKSGPHKSYEERKKFFNKNNTIQHGHYHKRQNGRYQNSNIQGEIINEAPKKEDVRENKECSKVMEDPVAEQTNGVLISKNPSPKSTPEIKESSEQLNASFEAKPKPIAVPKKQMEVPVQNGISKEDHEKMNNCSKFQPRTSNITPSQATPSRDNNNSDLRNRWPRRDEKIYQKRDQSGSEDRISQGDRVNSSPNHKFNKRFTPNSPAKKQTATQTTSYHDNSRRYSETVKKASPTTVKPTFRDYSSKTAKEIKPVIPEVTNTPINSTQWISVSSKKKRRNKNIEDSDNGSETQIVEDEEEEKQSEPQENKLTDFEPNAFLQNMINGHAKVEETQIDKVKDIPEIIRKSPVKILEVRDLEKELLSNVGVEVKEESDSLIAAVKIVEPTKNKSGSKKKVKKGGQKQPTKRVFITDLDLSELLPEVRKEEAKEDVKLPEELEEALTAVIENTEDNVDPVKVVKEEVIEDVTTKVEVVQPEPTEKKSKKKKKKSKNTESVSCAPTNAEDTYDLLLENTLSNNCEDKTNMEISQELDLIIQRGMYSNLEEKIKALNIIPIKEEFFQSVVRSSRESSTEKSPEFTKLLVNSMPKFKYCMASVEDEPSKLMVADLNQPSTSRNDLFVENPEVDEILKDIYGKEGTPEAEIGELITRSSPPKEIEIEKVKENSVEKTEMKVEEKNEVEIDKEKLYPITQAVKNWMSKTRENTPEVEILKSPSKIFKEFCEIDDASTKNGLVNGKRSSIISESDEEITVYSASRNNSDTADLLECWENEISSNSEVQTSLEEESKLNGDIKEEDDQLEVYESKYGQNEDFLELQREIEEKKKQEQDARSRNFPKHGALPYRAICCNVM